MDVVEYRVTGISPVLMHSAAGMTSEAVTTVNRGQIPSAEDEAEKGAYRLPSGQLYLPSQMFRSSLLKGAIGQKIGKKSAPGVISGAVFTIDPECPMLDPKTDDPVTTYEIDIRRAVVQRNGVRRARAMIREWACHVQFEIDPVLIQAAHITEVFTLAGKIKGVGDYRPEKQGPFGRYTIELIAQY